ncbi:YtpR family tRNA-binding protein [Geomicrobium sediminis]|uniref:tRNA-binding protein n=1 Tax=Geomicrobium sediminis TaxID=1347788 RepID=A0ABS2PAK8_9BACL|nr:DUF4479 family protein [Geomicrobium sediminis]MBM7631873.1 tRNA-binding protein [Geomicrobium sediminis]
MNAFYNKQGIGDVLLLAIKEIDTDKRQVERKGEIARLYHENSGETVGYHFFNVSSYASPSGTGMLYIDDALLTDLNKALEEEGIDDELTKPSEPSFVVGHVDEIAPHPDADKLRVCQVDVGSEQVQIVCGARNVDEGQKIVVAKVGANMPSGMRIKASKLRGEKSNGMICSIKELALPIEQEEKGIYVLPDRYEVGQDFLKQFHNG